jgi:glycyl-tRNA synthetase beta chain
VPDFLLELLSEEIPARMQGKASADLARLFEAEIAKAGLAAEAVETYATPRRLALIARALPAATAVSEETKGPRTSAPPQALDGFLRKTGLSQDQLVERDGVWFAVVDRPGRAATAVLAEAVPAIVRAFPWPKSMRWGAASASTESLRWVRPLQGIVALLGEEIVDFEIAGISSGAATVGHRFHHPGIITIGSAGDYVEKLRACHIILDPTERRRLIAEGAAAAAAAAGLSLVQDEGLLDENAGLTEWPVPLLGGFDPAFLDVPPEVIRLTMRTNQKYFALTDREGRLAPNFICVANIEAADGGAAIVEGNRKVLAARLADARFFWEQDLKVRLEEQAEKLSQIVFHEKLGTVADKVDRVAKLARWLVEEGIVGSSRGRESNLRHSRESGNPDPPAELDPRFRGDDSENESSSLAALAERAARLCKADLVTQMVGEFPELQGAIGSYLARAQGEPDEVADAVRDHYKPVGQGDEVPTAPVTVAVSLADKLDTLYNFFAADERPSGSKDPYALRRQSLAVVRLLLANSVSVSLLKVLLAAVQFRFSQLMDAAVEGHPKLRDYVIDVIEGRRTETDWLSRYRAARDDESIPFNITYESEAIDLVNAAFAQVNRTTELTGALIAFFADRLKVQQREAGVRHDLIDAVFALGGEDDLVRLLARVRALQAFVETPEGADLLAGYKRAANILKKEGWSGSGSERHPGLDPGSMNTAGTGLAKTESMDPDFRQDDAKEQPRNKPLSYTPEKEEAALIAALESAEPRARAAVEAEDFERAMAALASLRAPVDAFFDKVTVNDPDKDKRTARLALLGRMRDAVHSVADFSKIEG